MLDNQMGYSDEWQPYIGYDKGEYDIMLHDGTIVNTVYPNAGIFFDLKPIKRGEKQKTYAESEVKMIKFTSKKSFNYE